MNNENRVTLYLGIRYQQPFERIKHHGLLELISNIFYSTFKQNIESQNSFPLKTKITNVPSLR